MIRIFGIGVEPDTPGHWEIYGGTPEKFERLLQLAKKGVKSANKNVVFARGKTNPGRGFDDFPDMATADRRYKNKHLYKSFPLFENNYEMFGINYNNYYTELLNFVPWLKYRMNQYGYETSFYVADAMGALWIKEKGGISLPPYYPDKNNNNIEDVIEIMDHPSHPDYDETKKLYNADQARIIPKKAVIGLYTGMYFFSFQPSYDGEDWDGPHWHHAGIIDLKEYYDNGRDVFKALKPGYYTLKLFIAKVVGADRDVEKLDLGDHVYAFKFLKDNKPLIFIWHENNFDVDRNTNLVRRNQLKTVDLSYHFSKSEVIITHIVTELDGNKGPIYPTDEIKQANSITIDETPIFVEE